MRRNAETKKRRIPLALKIGALVICVFSVVSTVQIRAENSRRLAELAKINEQIEAQEIKNKEILALVEMGEDEEYIEAVARTRWGFVYPQEKVFVDIMGK